MDPANCKWLMTEANFILLRALDKESLSDSTTAANKLGGDSHTNIHSTLNGGSAWSAYSHSGRNVKWYSSLLFTNLTFIVSIHSVVVWRVYQSNPRCGDRVDVFASLTFAASLPAGILGRILVGQTEEWFIGQTEEFIGRTEGFIGRLKANYWSDWRKIYRSDWGRIRVVREERWTFLPASLRLWWDRRAGVRSELSGGDAVFSYHRSL